MPDAPGRDGSIARRTGGRKAQAPAERTARRARYRSDGRVRQPPMDDHAGPSRCARGAVVEVDAGRSAARSRAPAAADDRDRLATARSSPRAGARARWCRGCGGCARSRGPPAAADRARPQVGDAAGLVLHRRHGHGRAGHEHDGHAVADARLAHDDATPSVRSTISPSPSVAGAAAAADRHGRSRPSQPREAALADLQDAPSSARPRHVRSAHDARRRAAPRPGRAAAAPRSARRRRRRRAAPAGGPRRRRRTRRSATSSGARCSTRTRSKCASAPLRRLGAVEARDDRPRERALGVARRRRPRAAALERRSRSNHVAIASSGTRSVLAVHLLGRLGDADVVAQRLRHLLARRRCPAGSACVRTTCSGLPVGALDVAAEQQVELLVGAAELDVGAHRHRVVALQQRIEQLEHARSARAPRSAWRSRRARAAARRSSCARGGTGPPSACRATRRCGAPRALGVVAQHLERLLLVGRALRVDLLAESTGRVAERPLGSPTRAV